MKIEALENKELFLLYQPTFDLQSERVIGVEALIRTLVQLGKTLQIETLAEGIEDQNQLEILQREHCD